MSNEVTAPYSRLSPDLILDAVEAQGWLCDGRLLALNSYENRVYQIGIDDGPALVAKFYRPQRWSDAAIREEHSFTLELEENEIPVIAPLKDNQGETLFSYEGFRFALFPSRGGRHPELDCDEHLQWLGRYIGRIHAVGALRLFAERPSIDVASFGEASYKFVLAQGLVPPELEHAYCRVAEDVLAKVRHYFAQATAVKHIRLHGDCHMGNVLWSDEGPLFLDFDDCRSGPAIQDLWMLLSGERRSKERQLDILLEGYNQFYDFDPRELLLIEPLRTLRLLHYSAWLARRWHDPAFPTAFPWFNTPRYWEEQILTLKEQMAVLDEPVLSLY